MTDLAEWLLTCIAEDEADLRQPTGADYCDDQSGAHYSTARVLAECDAKRRIIEQHAPDPEYDAQQCRICDWDVDCDAPASLPGLFPCLTVRLLALPYADRPGYRKEWAP